MLKITKLCSLRLRDSSAKQDPTKADPEATEADPEATEAESYSSLK